MDAGSDVASSGRSNTSNGRNNASKINKLTSKVKCGVCTQAIVITKPSNIENKSKLSNVEIKSMNINNPE